MSSSVKFAAIEDKIAFFRRERVSPDVHEAHIRLSPGQTSEFHVHSVTRDTFYVVAGALEVRVVTEGEDAGGAYSIVGAPQVRKEPCRTGVLHRVTLRPGDVMVIHPRFVHASANVSDAECSFLCLEGPGVYDFIKCADPSAGVKHAV